jgi:hypothetical protein
MDITSDEIVAEYVKLKNDLGAVPSSKDFYKRISKHKAELAFGEKPFSKIQQAAGDKSTQFGIAGRTRDEFFETYGRVVRELKTTPKRAEWKRRRMTPTAQAYRAKLDVNWQEMPRRFAEWASNKADWSDAALICSRSTAKTTRTAEKGAGLGGVYLLRSGGYHKIGKSNSVGRREYELGLNTPDPCRLVHVIKTDDPDGIERYWLKRFESKRKNREWFQLSSDDIRTFKSKSLM